MLRLSELGSTSWKHNDQLITFDSRRESQIVAYKLATQTNAKEKGLETNITSTKILLALTIHVQWIQLVSLGYQIYSNGF